MNVSTPPGVFVLQRLLWDFTSHVNHKLEALSAQSVSEKHLMKCLQRGEDAEFDQLLCSLGCLAEHCLPSLVEILFKWLDGNYANEDKLASTSTSNKCDIKDEYTQKETQKIAVKIVFTLALIEILQQLPVHPLPEKFIQQILTLAFNHFKQATSLIHGNDQADSKARIVAELFSEVIGVIAKTKFQSVRKKFLHEIDDAKRQEHSTQTILSLVMGMKFFRVKMYPVEDFEASFRFLRELADFFLEAKDRELKHGLAALFVEILIPVAAAVKTEVNVPVLREFVDTLYPTSLEMSKRKKNQLAMYPLVTCLLCVSQKQFFLNNWHIFLENCLSNLKHRDQKVSRVALESLYRLLWTYTVRIKCESNLATQTRLQSIIKSLFPFGSRTIVPKDTPLSIYVKIIQFIAQERLDFAMKEIIMDLLGINLSSSRSSRLLTLQPERMNIGLRAFLVITDSLQQKDGAPPMPSTVGILPSGNTIRVKKVFLSKMLTEDDARTIGVLQYHQQVQRALDWMIISLDTQVGQKMMMTQRTSDVIAEDNKPKIELFRTCVAAMPRLIPVGDLCQLDLFELLSRLTIHIDEELRSLSFKALQLFALDFPPKREDVIATFISFILKQVNDTHPILLETALKHLVQLISGWKNKLASVNNSYECASGEKLPDILDKPNTFGPLIHRMEGFGLVLLCSNRTVMRKLACMLFKEYTKSDDELCIDVLDRLCPQIVAETIQMQEKEINMEFVNIEKLVQVAALKNFTALVEYSSSWTQTTGNLWSLVISLYMKPNAIPAFCPSAVEFSWGDVNIRLEQLWHHMDLAQISTSKKVSTIPNTMEQVVILWTNYLVYACSCAPSSVSLVRKQALSAIPAGTPDWYVCLLKDTERLASTSKLMEQNIANLKSENISLKECLLRGLGSTNCMALSDLLQVLEPLIDECFKIPRQENVRRKRKRDNLRLIISRLLENLAKQKVLGQSLCPCNDLEDNFPNVVVHAYINNTMAYLESVDKTEPSIFVSANQFAGQIPAPKGTFSPPSTSHYSSLVLTTLDDLRLCFASMVTELLKHLPSKIQKTFLSNECRRALFFMFGKWCEKYFSFGALDRLESMNEETSDSATVFHITMLRAECAVLCCGPIFDDKGLSEESGYLYPWLEGLLDCSNSRVHDVGKEAIILLLEQNEGCQMLLQWIIDKCYTGSLLVSSGCFLGICAAFSSVFLPNNFVALLNLSVFCMGNQDLLQPAKQLLLLLQYRLPKEDQTKKVFSGEYVNNLLSEHYQNTHYYFLSKKIAQLYPNLTVDILSDVFHRFQCTSSVIQRHMLQYIVPWIENIHLDKMESDDKNKPNISLFVLSNLCYITAQYHTSCELEVENCWRRLASSSLENLQYLLKFATTLLSSYFSEEISTTAKLIATYCAKAKPDTVTDFLIKESQMFEVTSHKVVLDESNSSLKFIYNQCMQDAEVSVECTSPRLGIKEPFLSFRQYEITENFSCDSRLLSKGGNYSFPENIHFQKSSTLSASDKRKMSSSLVSLPSSYNRSFMDKISDPDQSIYKARSGTFIGMKKNTLSENGFLNCVRGSLHYLPLHEFLPSNSASSALLRSDIACVLLYEIVVVHGLSINVKTFLSKVLLAITFGMDNVQFAEIPEKCRLLLAHVVILLLPPKEQEKIVMEIMSISSTALISVLSKKSEHQKSEPEKNSDIQISFQKEMSAFVKSFVLDLYTRSPKQMWPYDNSFPANVLKDTKLRGDEEIELFIHNLLSVFGYLVPDLPLAKKLSPDSLHFSLIAKPLHYKCRSLQVFRALGIPLGPKDICSVVLPLTTKQNVKDENDLQSLKIEILQTLLHSCDLVLKKLMEHGNNKADKKSVHGNNKFVAPQTLPSKVPFALKERPARSHSHKRSGSVTLKCKIENVVGGDLSFSSKEKAARCNQGYLEKKDHTKDMLQPLPSIENQCLLQIFWISVVVMESEYEYEYLLGLKILSKILYYVSLDCYDWCLDCYDYIQIFQWNTFEGIQFLLVKGLLSSQTFDLSYSALTHVTTLTQLSIVSVKGHGNAFATNVLLLLPYLVSKFNLPDHACCESAQQIAQVCVVDFKDHLKLQSLAHVMSLYVNKTYNKPATTWISVVCKYIYETFPSALGDQIKLLTQMLDEGYSFHQQCLQIMLSLYTLSTALSKELKEDFVEESLKMVAKHIHGKYWNEALGILKLAVTRSSHLVSPQTSTTNDVSKDEKDFIGLPGLTMSFQLDQINLQSYEKSRKLECESLMKKQKPAWCDRFQVMANVCSFFQNPTQNKSAALKTLQPRKEMIPNKQEPTQESFEKSTFSGGNKVDSNHFLDDMNSQGVLRDFDFLNEFEMEGDVTDNFNIGMPTWGSHSVKPLNDKDLNVSEDPLEVFDLTTVVDVEDNEKVDSDSSSVVTVNSMVGVSSDFSDPDVLSKESHIISTTNLEETATVQVAEQKNYTLSTTNVSSYYIRSTSPSPPVLAFRTNDEISINQEVTNIAIDSPLYSRLICQQSKNDQFQDDQINRWNALMQAMEKDKKGKTYIELFMAFQSMYHHLCVSFSAECKKGCSVLGSKLAGISSHFNELPEQLVCPVCLATPNTLIRHKSALTFGFHDLQEHINFFQVKKKDVNNTLEIIACACDTHPDKYDKEQKQLELCQQMYKLHFEILVLFQKFNTLVNLVSSSNVQDKPNSDTMNSMYRKFILFESEYKHSDVVSDQVHKGDMIIHCNETDAVKHLVDMIGKNDIESAFKYLNVLRKQWPYVFGLENDSCSAFLMYLYFWNYVKINCKEEYQVILGTKDCAPSISVKLMEVNSQIQQSLQLLELKPKQACGS